MQGQPRKREEPCVMPKPFPKSLIWEAYQHAKANGGAAGIDQETIERFEERLGDKLYKLWNRMCSGSYFLPLVKAVPIPKQGASGCWSRRQPSCAWLLPTLGTGRNQHSRRARRH
jgi:retron-type reverse transcriptase